MTNLTCAKIKRELLKIDPSLTADDSGFRAQVIMVSSLQVGPNIRKLAAFTKYPISEITKISRNLRKNQVWRGSKVHAAWFEKDGGIALACDTCVALGWIKRIAAERT